jgi:hypothetical protein
MLSLSTAWPWSSTNAGQMNALISSVACTKIQTDQGRVKVGVERLSDMVQHSTAQHTGLWANTPQLDQPNSHSVPCINVQTLQTTPVYIDELSGPSFPAFMPHPTRLSNSSSSAVRIT